MLPFMCIYEFRDVTVHVHVCVCVTVFEEGGRTAQMAKPQRNVQI